MALRIHGTLKLKSGISIEVKASNDIHMLLIEKDGESMGESNAPDRISLRSVERDGHRSWTQSAGHDTEDIEYVRAAANQAEIQSLREALQRIADTPKHLGSAFVNDLAVKIAEAALSNNSSNSNTKEGINILGSARAKVYHAGAGVRDE